MKALSIALLLLICSQSSISINTPTNEERDSYIIYPDDYKPKLKINSTVNEDIDFDSALNPSEIYSLPIILKQKLFSKSIISKQTSDNFGELLIGLASAWINNPSFLQTVIHSPSFSKDNCGIDVLYSKYQSTLLPKLTELIDLITKPIKGPASDETKEQICQNLLNNQLATIKSDINQRITLIEQLDKQLAEAKEKPDDINSIKNKIKLHQYAIKDYQREHKQLKGIDCKATIQEPNMTVRYSLMTMSAHLKDFLNDCVKCISNSVTGKAADVLTVPKVDALLYAQVNPLDHIYSAITVEVYEESKALFHHLRLTLAMYKLFKAYRLNQWDEFAFQIGRSMGLSMRVMLAILFSNKSMNEI